MSEKKKKIFDWIPALITVNVGLIVLYLTRDQNMHGITEVQLMYILPWTLILVLSGAVALTALNLKKITGLFEKVDNRTWAVLTLVILGGLYFRTAVVPHTHRIFFDEDLYMGIGYSIASEGKAIMCNRGVAGRCIEGILNKEPNGYPVLVGILYFIFGSGESIVYTLEIALATASILLVFLIAYLLFRSEKAALYSAFVLALTSSHIVWSGSTAAEIISAFFMLAAVFYALAYIGTQNNQVLLAATLVLAYATQVRPENALMIPLIVALILLRDKNIPKKLKTQGFCLPWIALIILITPHLIHTAHANRTDNWGASEEKISLKYFSRNLPINTGFFADGEKHPTAFTLFAGFGAAYMLLRKWRSLAFLAAWFAIFYGLYLIFYSGSFDSGGIGHRFALIVSTPLAFMAGYGMDMLSRIFAKAKDNRVGLAVMALIVLASLYSFNSTLPFIKTPDHQAQYAREMHDFALSHLPEIEENCHILTHTPSIFLIQNRPSLQTWFGGNNKVMDEVFSQTDCVYFLEGAWCLFPPHKDGVCKTMHTKYDLTPQWNMTREENTEHVFTLYRLRRK